jgi:hypothetical protein
LSYSLLLKFRSLKLSRRHLFPPTQQFDGFFTTAATHLDIRLKSSTDRRTFGHTKDGAQVFSGKMQATFPRGFAIGHAGNRGTDGRGNATGATAFTAFHDDKLLATGKVFNDAG